MASLLTHSYFWLIIALYLASYESEGPENHIEKDRWKSLRWVSLLHKSKGDVGLMRREPRAFCRKSPSACSASCLLLLTLCGLGSSRPSFSYIAFHFFILAAIYSAFVFLSVFHYFMERGTEITPWCGEKSTESLSSSKR